MKFPFLFAVLALSIAPLPAALVWDGGGDGVSVFAEANWTDNTGTPGTNPPADSVNGAAAVLFDCIIGGTTNAGGGGGAGNHFDLGSGHSLTITDNASWLSNGTGGYAIRGMGGGASERLILSTTGTTNTTFLSDIDATLSNSATLELSGGGNPLNNSTIELSNGWSGQIRFPNELVADVQSEHLTKITVNGAPAQDGGAGQNVQLASDGGSGSILSLPLPPADTDLDGIDDNDENLWFKDLDQNQTTDFDQDGVLDIEEINIHGTDPTNIDTDGDLLTDGAELTGSNGFVTDPTNSDHDHDGNPDGFEVAKGTDPTNASDRTDRPNIIFILCDDLGYGDLGVLFQNGKSGKKHLTPHLDQMAADGMILDRHYTPAPVCAPCRGSLMQGVHQGHANVRDNQFDKALQNNHTLATTLKAAGYSTSIIGKWGLQGGGGSPAAWPAYPTKRGFDYFFGYVRHGDGHTHYPDHVTDSRGLKELYDQNTMIRDDLDKCYTADLFTARAKKLIIDETTTNPNKPFFLYLAFDTPHAALQLPTQAYPAGSGTTGGIQWTGTPGSMINTASGTIDSFRHPDYTTAVGNAWTDVEERFATSVRRLDDCVGDLRQTLVDLGIANNTLIVFTSDNGPHTEDYLSNAQTNDGSSYTPQSFDSYGPFEGVKRDNWEGGIRMPTLVAWPGTITAGQTNSTPSQMHDWMPTFVELAGWTPPSRTDGVSLLPLLTGVGTQKSPFVYIEYANGSSTPNYGDFSNHGGSSRNQMQTIFLEGFKGVRYNIGSHATPFQIYDITTDVSEGNDLTGSNAFFTGLQQRMKDTVLRARQVDSSAARPYDAALVPAVSDLVEPGLRYAQHEGLWPWIPEFELLTPITEGLDTKVAASTHLSRPDNAGLYYSGYLNVPAGGTWTFFADSDSGVHLRIHDSQVIDDDFTHDGSEASGTILLEAGLHPFRLYYRSRLDTPSLNFSWSGPGTSKELIPDGSFFRAGTPDPEPTATDDEGSTSQNTPLSIDVLANDLDDGAPSALAISSIGSPSGGTAVESSGKILYTPNPSFLGTDSFDYTLTDGQFFASATVTVMVTFPATDLWIPLNEGGGSTIFEAGGSILGGMSSSSIRTSGPAGFGMALGFDGVDAEFPLPGTPTLPSGSSPRTIMCWIRVPTGESKENQTMFGYGTNSNGQRFSFRLNGSSGSSSPGTPQQAVRLEVQGGNIVGNTLVDDGNWHHVAIVCNDFNTNGALQVEESKIYVDGVLDTNPFDSTEPIIPATASSPENMNTFGNSTPVLGGSNHSGGYSFHGEIDELRLFPAALSASQVQEQMTATTPEAAWHRRFFGNAPIDWNADNDNDGTNRLGELAFGGQPWINDTNALRPTFFLNPVTHKLEITFRRRTAGAFPLLYSVQASNDLLDWMTLTTSELRSNLLSSVENLESAVFETDATTTDEATQFSRIMTSLP